MTRHASFFYPLRWRPVDLVSSRWCDHFIVVSESLKRQFVDRGYGEEKVTVVHNGVELFRAVDRRRTRESLALPENLPLVGAVGRLTPQKGMDTFLRAAQVVARENADARFLVAGDGEEAASLKKLAGTLGIADRVLFPGYRDDVFDVLAALDVLVYLSRWEPFANTILEAMAVGTPVVATDVGGNAEVLRHRETGMLVPVEDPGGAALCILDLLRNPGLARQLSARAADTVRSYSIEAMTRGHEEVYERLVTG